MSDRFAQIGTEDKISLAIDFESSNVSIAARKIEASAKITTIKLLMVPCTSGATRFAIADDDQLTRSEKFTKSRRESRWWSSSPLLHFRRGILLFLFYVPSYPQSSSAYSRRTGRSREFLFSQGVVGKSRRASGRKGVTDTLLSDRSGNSFRAWKPAGTSFSWYDAAHPPRSRNYACWIESLKNGGRGSRIESACQPDSG